MLCMYLQGSSSVSGESVSEHVHDVDIFGFQRDPLFENLEPFVDQRVYAALHDLLVTDHSSLNTLRGCVVTCMHACVDAVRIIMYDLTGIEKIL
jgi:hypothetical protein